MPKCIFKTLTGYDCPGCGASRALHAFLHGNLKEALAYNYFIIIGVTYAGLASLCVWIPNIGTNRLRNLIFGKKVAWIYIFLFFSWWILRNMNWFKELL